MRLGKREDITGLIFDVAKTVLEQVQQRCTEAIEALQQHDYLAGIGALAGVDEQLRSVTVKLMVLRELKQIQKQKSTERRKHGQRINGFDKSALGS